MKSALRALLACLVLSVASLDASAQTFNLDFQDPNGYGTSILNYYGGGTDTPGTSAQTALSGTNYGITFGADDLVLPSSDALGTYFTNGPNGANTSGISMVGPSTAMNSRDAITAFSFAYTADASVYGSGPLMDAVQLWSGADGTGTILGSFSLNTAALCSTGLQCSWSSASLASIAGAHSVTFSSAVSQGFVVFTNFTITAAPEPSTYALLGLGLVALFASAARRRRV